MASNTYVRSTYVRSLKICNFKAIAELDLRLDDSLTLLAGVNGVGKTSAIEALLATVTRAWNRPEPFGELPRFTPSGDLLRYSAHEGQIGIELAIEPDKRAEWFTQVKTDQLMGKKFSTHGFSDPLLEHISPVPLVVYYRQNRMGGSGSDRSRLQPVKNRAEALDTTSHALSDFRNWYFEKESDEARKAKEIRDVDYSDPEVRAVQEVLKSVAGSSTSLRSRKPDGTMDRMLFLRKEGGTDIPFEALSGGEQAYFLLAVDLARRLLLEFPRRTLAEAPGLVCIDEIELHLHPAWQRKILTSLMDLFPRCQFVVTTHSPQVIGSVAARHVRLLSSNETGVISVTEPIASRGRDTNYVLAGVMDTPEQDPEVHELFTKFDRLIDDGALDEADRVLDDLDALIEGSSSRVSLRRAKCRRLRSATE